MKRKKTKWIQGHSCKNTPSSQWPIDPPFINCNHFIILLWGRNREWRHFFSEAYVNYITSFLRKNHVLSQIVFVPSKPCDISQNVLRCPDITREIACVAWRFWLGALSNKGGWGQRNREEIGAGATFSRSFAARSLALRARISRLRRSCARLDKTAMLRRLHVKWNLKCTLLC